MIILACDNKMYKGLLLMSPCQTIFFLLDEPVILPFLGSRVLWCTHKCNVHHSVCCPVQVCVLYPYLYTDSKTFILDPWEVPTSLQNILLMKVILYYLKILWYIIQRWFDQKIVNPSIPLLLLFMPSCLLSLWTFYIK